eukprot:jgi/Chlat1/1050/Chrsp110S01560
MAQAAAPAGPAVGHEEQKQQLDPYGGLESVVPFSSRLIAAYRAVESARSPDDRLFVDPLAVHFAGAAAMREANAGQAYTHDAMARIAVRTKYFDDAILAALKGEQGTDTQSTSASSCQLVMLGAGMDSRAWRLPAPSTAGDNAACQQSFLANVLFEVDQEKLPFKPTLSLAQERRTLSLDLLVPGWEDKLMRAGFEPQRRTVWVSEGLFMYLSPEAVDSIVRTAARISAPGSVLVAHFPSARAIARSRNSEMELARTWTFGSDDPGAYVAERGWSQPNVALASFGRYKNKEGTSSETFYVVARKEA